MSGIPPHRIGGPGTRLLLVHAHPDDETIFNGATMAAYAAAGTRVTLVTCTRGELGEVIPPEALRAAGPREGRPPLVGALLKNEQDVHLFEQLIFLQRRQSRQ